MAKMKWMLTTLAGAAAMYLAWEMAGLNAHKKSELDPVIIEGICKNAERFHGLYEGIYSAVEDKSLEHVEAYQEWHIRMESLQENDEFYHAFVGQFPRETVQLEHLHLLLHYIRAAGIIRNAQSVHIADANSAKQYVLLNDEDFCIGKKYKVLKPCWMQNETVVQQGLLTSAEE